MKYRIIELLKETVDELKDVEIMEDTKLISSGYMESFGVINLISALEEEYHIEIPLEEIEFEAFNQVSTIERLILEVKKAC